MSKTCSCASLPTAHSAAPTLTGFTSRISAATTSRSLISRSKASPCGLTAGDWCANLQKDAFIEGRSGAPGKSRTCDLLVRSQTLYPAELRAPRNAIAVRIDYDTPPKTSTSSASGIFGQRIGFVRVEPYAPATDVRSAAGHA